jgi:hypothetical protein
MRHPRYNLPDWVGTGSYRGHYPSDRDSYRLYQGSLNDSHQILICPSVSWQFPQSPLIFLILVLNSTIT